MPNTESEYQEAAGASWEDQSWAESDEKKRARILAEKFSGSLSEMDRFYNRYILINAGEYIVGSKSGNDSPRRVRLPQFYMGKFPVTNGLFDAFVEKTGYVTTAERAGYGTVYYGRYQKRLHEKTGGKSILWSCSLTSRIVQGAFWYQPFGPGSTLHHKRNHPVVQVSMEDCMAFAAWSGKRLPTEDEWEAASRTMKGNLYPWGNRFRKNACNLEKEGHGETTPVDRYLKFENEYGIADALGNILEWTTGMDDHPEKMEKEEGTVRLITKGGSWATDKAVDLTSRTEMRSDSHSNILGFRCVAV
jgi:formylglycine-generating enzyme required for sulfatase activity